MITVMTSHIDDPEARSQVFHLIEVIGESLVAGNANAAAIVALADANQRLLTATISLAEYANLVAGGFVQANATQQ